MLGEEPFGYLTPVTNDADVLEWPRMSSLVPQDFPRNAELRKGPLTLDVDLAHAGVPRKARGRAWLRKEAGFY